MALVCSKCSTENADGALVCRHCGAALPPPTAGWGRSLLPEDDEFDPLSAPTLVMQHTAPAALPPIEESLLPRPARRDRRRLLLAGLVVAGLLVAVGAWMWRPADTPPSAAAPEPAAPAASASAAVPAASAALPPEMPASAVVVSAVIAPPASVPSAAPVASAALAAAAAPAAGSAVAAGPAASPVEGRKRIPEPVARKRALAAPPAASSVVPPPAAAVPVPVVASQPVPERPKTVSELCAGGNLITRGFCEQRECRRSDHANDPVCAKLRDAEQRRLFQQ